MRRQHRLAEYYPEYETVPETPIYRANGKSVVPTQKLLDQQLAELNAKMSRLYGPQWMVK
jgi:hypothetical protein